MVIELIVALSLIGVVLLLPPKGEGMGSIGGQARIFNAARGLNSGLDRMALGLSVVFLVLAFLLGIMG